MKKRIVFTALIVICAFLAGATAGVTVFYWRLYDSLHDPYRYLQDAIFAEQVESIRQLQQGSDDKALEYLRAMNDYSLQLLHENSIDELNVAFLNRETVEFACDDLKKHPNSWFTGGDQSRENINSSCDHLLKLFDEKP